MVGSLSLLLRVVCIGSIATGPVAVQLQSFSDLKRLLHKDEIGHAKAQVNGTAEILKTDGLKDLNVPYTPVVNKRVKHKDFLNDTKFWILMGALIFGVTMAMAKVERDLPSNEAVQENKSGDDPSAAPDSQSEEAPTRDTVKDYVVRLVFCVIALNLSMILWGIAQEYVTTNIYLTSDGQFDQIPSTLFLVFCNRTCTTIICSIILKWAGKPFTLLSFSSCGPPAIANGLASWSQYGSLSYISFTLQTTAKSAKLLPVLLISSLRGKSHSIYDYTEAIVIVCGLVVFGFEVDAPTESTFSTGVGIVLLCAFLLFDSLTPHLQDVLFTKSADVDVLSATQSMAFYGSLFSCGVLLVDGGLVGSVQFLAKHPQAILHILILSYASCITQYLISYTIKHFGPVTFTVIACLRQLISVSISVTFFNHYMSTLGTLALILVIGTLFVRTIRMSSDHFHVFHQDTAEFHGFQNLVVCTCGIHVLYLSYGVLQEFLATHYFEGALFEYPLFLIAANHMLAAVFALLILKCQQLPVFVPKLHYTTLPAIANAIATFLQHQALYSLFFPVQTLMKSLKVIPVMLVGRILKNRTYDRVDYAEALLITILVCFFVWDFQFGGVNSHPFNGETIAGVGILLMVGYVIVDAFTPNLEDTVYQLTHIDPGQMLFGLELISGIFAWIALGATGQFWKSIMFFGDHPEAMLYVGLLALASAVGAYSCTLTVRLFGPAVFTLIMVSRQVLSLVISVIFFQHEVRVISMLCLILVIVLILASSFRQVHKQMHVERMAGDSVN